MWLISKLICYPVRGFASGVPTIFALSSGQGKCGVAVIRVSGPRASDAIFKMTKATELPKPRMAKLHYIRDPESLEELDRGLVLWFPGPKSFTGEDSCEFQIHGGPAVIEAVLTGLSKLPYFRPAEPGDFTKRAFFAGKLDLIEVEGLGDLIHAETEFQRKQALFQMEGNLSNLYKKWRSIIVKNLAHMEAYIDFSEDENIEDDILKNAQAELNNLRCEIKCHLLDGRKGERLRDGIQTAIIGEPNAGKSSLLNAICQKPAAIVTPIPGTTRDTIQMHINIGGFPITLIDTAGLRVDATDVVEREGILRAKMVLKSADLVLIVIDASKLVESSPESLSQEHIHNFLKGHINCLEIDSLNFTANEPLNESICIFNKIDLLTENQKKNLEIFAQKYNINCISCKSEEGFETFVANLTKFIKKLCANPTRENPSLTNSRHRHHLTESLKFLNEYFTLETSDVSLSAQKLRLSARHIGKIIGTVSSEEILDIIFKDFCIGK